MLNVKEEQNHFVRWFGNCVSAHITSENVEGNTYRPNANKKNSSHHDLFQLQFISKVFFKQIFLLMLFYTLNLKRFSSRFLIFYI